MAAAKVIKEEDEEKKKDFSLWTTLTWPGLATITWNATLQSTEPQGGDMQLMPLLVSTGSLYMAELAWHLKTVRLNTSQVFPSLYKRSIQRIKEKFHLVKILAG